MADISATFFILLIISVAFLCMFIAWWLLFPSLIMRAQTRVEKSLARSFWLGLLTLIAVTVPIVFLLALPIGPAKFTGWILLAASLALSSIGSAGIAGHLSEQMKRASNGFTPWADSSAVQSFWSSQLSFQFSAGSSSGLSPSSLPSAPQPLRC